MAEVVDLIRTENNYVVGQNGVTEVCILNDLSCYKVFNNFYADVMHDGFLGEFKVDISEILLFLFVSGFDVEEINSHLSNFDWGYRGQNNKPPYISENRITNKNINMYAKQVWNFTDYLLFYLRNFLATDHVVYIFAITVVDILDILVKSEISDEDLVNLSQQITEHHNQFLELFGELTPKMHFLTHYPRLMRLCGPLRHVWCFAPERKHQFIKRYTNVNKNKKDTGFSIGRKMGLQEATAVIEKTDIFKKVSNLSKVNEGRFAELFQIHDCESVDFLTYKGTDYRINDLVLSNDQNYAHEIREIYANVEEDRVFLIMDKRRIEFVPHYRSYQLFEILNDIEMIDIDVLRYPPVDRHLYYGDYFFRIKHF